MGFWTYQYYNYANVFIIIALGLITFIILFFLERFTSASYYLFTKSLFGIQRLTIPKNIKSLSLEHGSHTKKEYTAADLIHIVDVFGHHVNLSKRKHLIWRIVLFLLTGATIWLFFIQIFTSIILRYQVVYPNEICPNFLADCFAIPTRTFDYSLIGMAICTPGSFFTFPIVAENGTAHCFGWVIKNQDTASVLAAIGSSAALITFIGKAFTTMFHLTYEHMRSHKWLVIAVFMGIIVLWTGVFVYLFQQKVTSNIQTYYVLVHIALIKSTAVVWGFVAEYDELTPEEQHAFWPFSSALTPRTQHASDGGVMSQSTTTKTRSTNVVYSISKATNSPVSVITSKPREVMRKDKTKLKPRQVIKDISQVAPEPEERNGDENKDDSSTAVDGNAIPSIPNIPDSFLSQCSVM